MKVLHARIRVLRGGGRDLLANVEIVLSAGEILAVTGATGCGKSRLVRALCGLDAVDGEILLGPDGDADSVNHAGVLLAMPGLMDDRDVFTNVAWRYARGGPVDDAVRARVMDALGSVGLAHAADMFPAQLSGGMLRRAALARALVHHPPLLMLDDPTAGLDPITARGILQEIRTLAGARGTAVLFTTHAEDLAWSVAGRVLGFRGTDLVELTPPAAPPR